MVIKKNQFKVIKLIKLLVLLSLSYSITFAQSYVTHIPTNSKIETITNWLVSKQLPSTFYLDGKENEQMLDGFSKDFLISIGGEKSPKIKVNETFNTPDGKNSSFFQHSWQNNYLDLEIANDMASIEKIINKLNWQLLITFSIIMMLLGVILWITLNQIALIPLETEINKRTEELRQHRDHL